MLALEQALFKIVKIFMLTTYSLKDIVINPGLVLAPMSGVTTSAFRRLIKDLNGDNVGLLVTEFISVEAMTRNVRRSLEMMKFRDIERPLCIQIFGFDIDRMRDAARMVEDAGADVVDINSGCPAPKVVRKGGGCELMRQPKHVAALLNEVRKNVSIPLTLKMRSGWDEQSKNCLEIARIAESEGVDSVTIHGRTRSQSYRGVADWSHISEVTQEVRIPVCGSGDIVDRNTALERLSYGAAGLYIGRAAIENPLVFSEIISGEERTIRRNEHLAVKILKKYIDFLSEDFSEMASLGKLKQLASQMCKGRVWRKEILHASSVQGIIDILNRVEDESADVTNEVAC